MIACSRTAEPQKKQKENKHMRLDKYLKVSRIIKRRTVANEACDEEHQRRHQILQSSRRPGKPANAESAHESP